MIQQVGLTSEYLERYPFQLSGGQRQRAAIAAALIVKPKLVILDEPVSSLDVTIQAQILHLLKELQKKHNLTYIFISHDLNVIFQMCNRVCVIYRGEIVEMKEAKELLYRPPARVYQRTAQICNGTKNITSCPCIKLSHVGTVV